MVSMTDFSAACKKNQLLKDIFYSAVTAASPDASIAKYLPQRPSGRTVVVGAGKAGASMAVEVERAWGDEIEGLVVVPYAHGLPTKSIEVVQAAHPVPDAQGEAVAGRLLNMVSGLSPDDLVLCLISGGGSALMALPADGLSLADKREINSRLLKSGAAIDEMNTVRKHLSKIKGGRLGLMANPARVVTIGISDVPGDDPAVIASGPTVADPTTFADAMAVLEKYSIEAPQNVLRFLQDGMAGKIEETPKPGDERMARCEVHLIATPAMALAAAGVAAKKAGYEPLILGDDIEGEAREVGLAHARLAIDMANAGKTKVAIISGGETTVTVKGTGRGGRNGEYLLGLVLGLDGHRDINAIACDTDGIDGTEKNAGAICGPDTLSKGRGVGLDGAAMLDNNDAYSFFAALDDLIITGPTLTNVNDFRCILIG